MKTVGASKGSLWSIRMHRLTLTLTLALALALTLTRTRTRTLTLTLTRSAPSGQANGRRSVLQRLAGYHPRRRRRV